MKYVATKVFRIAIAVIVLVIAMVLFISIRQSQRVKDTARSVSNTEEIRLHFEQLILSVLDNETGARGFVITGRPEFLQPLRHSEERLHNELGILDRLVKDSQAQQLIRDSLSAYINKRIAFSQQMVDTRQQEGMSAAAGLVLTGIGKFYTDRIRNISDDLRQRLVVLLDMRRKSNQLRVQELNFVLYSVISTVFVLSLIIIYTTQADVKRRKLNEQKFRSLLDAAPDATLIVNKQGTIQMINHQTERLFGYKSSEMIGQSVQKLIPSGLPVDISPGTAVINEEKDFKSAGIELTAIKKNAFVFPVEISLSPIETNEGMLISASLRDITLRKKLENDLKKTNAELEAFTYSVSHDLRAPLRGIVGFTAILEDEYTNNLDAEARRLTGIIKSNTLKMGHLIDDLLAFSRMGRQDILKTVVDMDTMVHSIIEELTQQDSRSVEWIIHPLPEPMGDMNTLRQVWVNLISNAIKYSSKASHPRIEIGSYEDELSIVYYVKDNGVGFDEQYSNKLFKVFQRLHSEQEFEGTGVGLALVEKIVSKHGGKAWANSSINKGATFNFSIPVN